MEGILLDFFGMFSDMVAITIEYNTFWANLGEKAQ